MTSPFQHLSNIVQKTLESIVPEDMHPIQPMLKPAGDKKFGDFQSNAALALAKQLKTNPRELATKIIEALKVDDVCSKVEIAGPGFINFFLKPDFLAESLNQVYEDERLGVPKVKNPEKSILDFSSPNLAKEMHIGHLRTTITGEVIARILEFVGHKTERVNHVGDWGTQFGMLLEYLYQFHPEVVENPESFQVSDLQEFYKKAKKEFDENEKFKDLSRKRVVLLQSGDETALKLWKTFLNESLRHCHELYKVLDVTLEDVGESFYNDKLADTVQELKDLGLAVEDNGAICVFIDGYENREGKPLPMIIQKSDGGYNYDTTDLAAIKYRIQDRKGNHLIYITDIRQAQHFDMLFKAARKAGWATDSVKLDHIGYGMILGQDRKPFKTRSGETVRLKDVIEESVSRAKEVIKANQERTGRSLQYADPEQVAEAVGLAAIKYYDLSHNLSSDYVFHWDQMLSMEGNTGPYMLYAYARIKSIGRKANVDLDKLSSESKILLEKEAEFELAKEIIRFSDVVHHVSQELKPNLLTDYLYQLSKTFNTFYDKQKGVSVLNAETEELKQSRLKLCALTARTLKQGLNLLSLKTVEEM